MADHLSLERKNCVRITNRVGRSVLQCVLLITLTMEVSSIGKENTAQTSMKDESENAFDVLSYLGLDISTNRLALIQTRAKFKALKMPMMLSQDPLDTQRLNRAKLSVSRLSRCLVAEESSDCILLAHPCVKTFQEMSNGKISLGEYSCPVLLPSTMSTAQSLAIAERTLGVETYFEWGSGSSTEMLAPLAIRSYSVEHYQHWCDCLRARPLARCIAEQQFDVKNSRPYSNNILSSSSRDGNMTSFALKPKRIFCVANNLNLRSFGRLQQNGINNTHKNIGNAHRAYVEAIDGTGELSFEVILIDGRAYFSCALKALGYTTNTSTVFMRYFTQKFDRRILRYYDIERTIDFHGKECRSEQNEHCIAQFKPKLQFVGNHEVHQHFLSFNHNFMRSPVNF
mmetsp:Transcript_12242/g.16536  ORF Transcript_12242/g.16536 Transcript_12242/m.16536 type:complete len:398 (-) Transcript_12242:56-1249(-)